MRAFLFALLFVWFAPRLTLAQIEMRLLETPIQGADATFGVHAGAGRPFLFLLSAGTGGFDALDVFDLIDPRHLGVDLGQLRYVAEGTLDAHGDAVVLVPASYLQPFQSVPFFAQALTYPGFTTSIDELSNVVSSRVGTGIGSITGVVLDEADQPIVGAIVEIVENTARRTVTAANGSFRIDRVRPGRVHVAVDATQVNAGPGANFARIVLPIDIEDGLVNPVGYTVFIPRAVGGTAITPALVGAGGITTQPIAVTAPTPEGALVLTIPAGTTITFGDGTHSGKTIQVLRVPSDHTPMPMPDDVLPRWDYAIYPPDVVLDPPVPFTFWTDQVLTVGSRWDFIGPDHESIPMRFATRGVVTVLQSTAAGSQCAFVQGGMTGGGWGTMFQSPAGESDKGPEDPPPCPKAGRGSAGGGGGGAGGAGGGGGRVGLTGLQNGANCTVEPVTGNLYGDIQTPPHRVGDQDLGLQFVYNSDRAAAQVLFSASASMNPLAMVPERYTLSGSLGGVAMQELFYDAGTRGLQPFQLVQSVSAPSLPTGEHSYRVLLKSIVQGSQFARALEGRRVVENFADSPFGAGWTLVDHDRITRLDDRRLLLSRGDGSRSIFEVSPAAVVFAGTGVAGAAGDGGRASLAQLRRPGGMAVH
ncbi:MAG: carboxypeptidase-like regulatory domain-containing protein, partial [Planctomycetota bacterium]